MPILGQALFRSTEEIQVYKTEFVFLHSQRERGREIGTNNNDKKYMQMGNEPLRVGTVSFICVFPQA